MKYAARDAEVLAAALVYGSVSGGLFTVALGFQGLALLSAGFALRERILRLQGLALLLAYILKLFVYDLRNLETMYRILSFVALGLIMLCVSWIDKEGGCTAYGCGCTPNSSRSEAPRPLRIRTLALVGFPQTQAT